MTYGAIELSNPLGLSHHSVCEVISNAVHNTAVSIIVCGIGTLMLVKKSYPMHQPFL